MREINERNPCEDRGCDCCLHFREAWSAGSIYRPGEAVPYNGSSYVALHLNQNDPPPSGNWALIASKGEAGPAGSAGATGPQGPAGKAGEGGGNDVFVTQQFINQDQGPFTPGGVEFAALSLSSGSYVVFVALTLANSDGDAQNWTVELHNGDTVLASSAGRIESAAWGTVNLVVPFVATSDLGTPLSLWGFGFMIEVLGDTPQVTLLAMRVGPIHYT
jgi:hypothetical protein